MKTFKEFFNEGWQDEMIKSTSTLNPGALPPLNSPLPTKKLHQSQTAKTIATACMMALAKRPNVSVNQFLVPISKQSFVFDLNVEDELIEVQVSLKHFNKGI